jgi:serine/threonine protein kinase
LPYHLDPLDWLGRTPGSKVVALVMERMACGLDRLMFDPAVPLAAPDVLQLLTDVSVGLANLHAHGIVHGDIKSFTEPLGSDDRAKLAGSGLAAI